MPPCPICKLKLDWELEQRCRESLETGLHEEAVRAAFVILEERLRSATGAPDAEVGVTLVDRAFHKDNGLLQVPSDPAAERQGLADLFRGVFLRFRNPISHRSMRLERNEAWSQVLLVNTCLSLIARQLDRLYDPHQFVSPHEGKILHKRMFRLDIDLDSEDEIVILLMMSTLDTHEQYGLPLILDKTQRGWKRVAAERVDGLTCEAPGHVELKFVTGREHPEIVTYWEHASGAGVVLYSRSTGRGYDILSKHGSSKTYSECSFHCTHWGFSIVDFDGDGLDEIVEVDYPAVDGTQMHTAWKWDGSAGQFRTVAKVQATPDKPRTSP